MSTEYTSPTGKKYTNTFGSILDTLRLKIRTEFKGAYFSKGADNPYHIDNGKGGKEDISWLL